MGTFRIQIDIGDPQGERWTSLDALVDTGASVVSAPASVLQDLNIVPLMRQSFRSAHGDVREMETGRTWVRFEGREVMTLVVFNDEGSSPLLGALALEQAFLGIDPVGQRLIPVEGLLMSEEFVQHGL